MIALDDMYYFVEVAKAMSFRKAAGVTGVPVSTLSRRVGALESSVGVRLFHRTTRKIELTDAGRAYYRRCKAIVDQARSANDEIRASWVETSGSLKVTMPVDFGSAILAPLVAEFAVLHPRVEFEFDLSSRQADLVSEPFDLAIRIGTLRDSKLISRRLCSLRRSLYASPKYLATNGAPKSPADLKGRQCVGVKAAGGNRWTLRRNGESETVTVHGRYVLSSVSMARRLTILDQGIANLADAIVAEDVAAGRLVRVLPTWRASSVPVYAITESRRTPARVQLFIAFLREKLGELLPEGD